MTEGLKELLSTVMSNLIFDILEDFNPCTLQKIHEKHERASQLYRKLKNF